MPPPTVQPMDYDLHTITTANLDQQTGKTVPQFCYCGYDDMHQHHCAHFVSHVLNVRTGLICGNMRYATRGRGVTVRANDLFNYCTIRGRWDDADAVPAAVAGFNAFLMFATTSGNIGSHHGVLVMNSGHLKHVGIYRDGKVWNFSNNHAHPQVIREEAGAFRRRIAGVYGRTTQFFYGHRVDI